MKLVKDILKVKGTSIWAVKPDTSVFDALQLMADKEIGAVLVMKDEELVGILSERDYARKVALQGKHSKELFVHEIMSAHLVSVTPDQNIEECMELVTGKKIRHLPVIENGKVIGLISIGDIVKETISEMQDLISQLMSYISGTP